MTTPIAHENAPSIKPRGYRQRTHTRFYRQLPIRWRCWHAWKIHSPRFRRMKKRSLMGAKFWIRQGSYRLSLKTYSTRHSSVAGETLREKKEHILWEFHFTTKIPQNKEDKHESSKKIVADLSRLWAMRYHHVVVRSYFVSHLCWGHKIIK